MTGFRYTMRSLWHYRKSVVGVVAGSALGAMVLLGALMSGDSVKQTLKRSALNRLGTTEVALVGGDRFFRSALADGEDAAPVLMVMAMVREQGGQSTGGVQVLGVDDRFWQFSPRAGLLPGPVGQTCYINESLAAMLQCKEGGALVIRVEKPSLAMKDAPLAGKQAELAVMRCDIRRVCGGDEFGGFGLQNNQSVAPTIFVPITRLQRMLGVVGKANLMLMHGEYAKWQRLLVKRCTIEDYGLSVVDVPAANVVEIRSSRIFFDRKIATVIGDCFADARPVITYMANTISAHGRSTPYSMVTAVDFKGVSFLSNMASGAVLNAWEADDLGVSVGDELRLDYYAVDAGNHLIEKSVVMPVTGVVPLDGLAADRMWMPDFPGAAEAKDAADWDAGVPIDLKRIRDKDEAYWDAHRGVPKVFIPLEAGRISFGNRWGDYTAMRVSNRDVKTVTSNLLGVMNLGCAGFTLRDVGSAATESQQSPVDFAGLFLGMSLFLMVAAVVLTAMMFRFHIELRNHESGLLAAVGIPSNMTMRWWMLEGGCVVLLGSLIGSFLAIGYTRGLLGLLQPIWQQPNGENLFVFHVSGITLLVGGLGFMCLMMVVVWVVARNQAQRSARVRLEAGHEEVVVQATSGRSWWVVGWLVVGLASLLAKKLLGVPMAFFLCGFTWLLGGIAWCRQVMCRCLTQFQIAVTPCVLARVNVGRRGRRTLVVVGTMACGVFMVVSVTAFRKHVGDGWRDRASGAGGFAYWMETTRSSNRVGGATQQDPAALGDLHKQFGHIIPIRVGTGDDASCFNLNQVARPRLLAVDAMALSSAHAFTIKSVVHGNQRDWSILKDGPVMRAFVDETTLLWVLKKKLGDRVIYQDDGGRDFSVEIAGVLEDSVFQGSFVVDVESYLNHYPSADGPRLFLIDEGVSPLFVGASQLRTTLEDRGVSVVTTRDRLAALHSVENTYIGIFNLLGGLGVIIGSAGLGLVTAQNLRDRKQEFFIMHVLGVPASTMRKVVMLEAFWCIAWGLGVGLVSAVVSILPSLQANDPWWTMRWVILLVLLIAINAVFWTWFGMKKIFGILHSSACQMG